MKPYKIVFLIFLLSSIISAQEKLFTLEEVILKGYLYQPKRMQQLQWIPGEDSFVFVKTGESPELLKGGINNDNLESLLTLSKLNGALEKAGLGTQKSFPRIGWVNSNTISFWKDNKLVSYPLDNGEAKVLANLPDEAENIDFQREEIIAYTIENNLYIHHSGKDIQVTGESSSGIVSGQSVSRNEFGISKGTFWSPENNYLAFYQKDESGVTDYPLVDISKHPASLVNIKYPMAGMTSETVRVGVYDVKANRTVWLESGDEKEEYLTNVTWSPDEKHIYIAHLNRDQNHMRLIKYDALTGKRLVTLFEEKDEEYVEPENGPVFLENDDSKFLWLSERDNWNHIYLYDTEGTLIRQVTSGEWAVLDVLGFDGNGSVFITATKESPIEKHLYKVNTGSGELTKITTEPGMHNVELNSSGTHILDTYSNLETPSVTLLLNGIGEVIRKLNDSPNPLADYKIGETKITTLESSSGYELYCRTILPAGFDPDKKYPVMVYVYGGPHAQLVTNSWLGGANLWFNYMAQNGYIVFTLDNRGSSNRGLQFEQETFRQLGTPEIEDQKTGVEYLKTLPYVDENNIGVFGWSYGGFMTVSLMTRMPGLFKIGAAGGAVIDWSYYEVMYTERYMDTPEQNPEGYKNSNLLNYVNDLKGKLLLVHGTSDPTVVWQHTLLFAQKAANLGIELDYYPYVGHGHGVGGKDAFHLYQKITNFFNENLKH